MQQSKLMKDEKNEKFLIAKYILALSETINQNPRKYTAGKKKIKTHV